MEKSELLNQLRIDRSAAAPTASSRTALILAAIFGVLLLIGALVYLYARGDSLIVETAVARSFAANSAQSSVLDATGYITARRLATVSAKVTGRVETVLIEEGMRVEEGQILATLEDVDAKAQRALAAAQLESSRSQLAEIRSNLANAEREAQRQEELAQRKLTSAQALDLARTQATSLRARLESARAQVEVAQRSLAIADIALDNTIVRAPFAGVITVKAAQPGEIISPLSAGGGFTRTGICTVVDMNSLEIEVDVNESYIGRVQSGQPVEAVLNAYSDWKIPAEVIAIIPTADRAKATVRVRIAIKSDDPRIVPDMGVRVAFLNDKPTPAVSADTPKGVLVPVKAVRGTNGANFVWLSVDGRAQRREVRAAGTYGSDQLLTEGLRAGERVIVGGPEQISEGQALSSSPPG